ncbi:hypothetical protein [Microbacterium sp. MYb62]|uniref:hypothetical protein n=1 Tax=Microbacterium sp. MYb62 TaxID=1848690 RepID=UPI0015E39B00|nr:hypothetical protein [Microbacterium sp. MYb62]
MSDPQTYQDDDREVEAEGIDPDMPSTDDDRVVPDDDEGDRESGDDIDLSDLP